MDQVEPTIYEASEADRVPCCAITEGGWTWFGSLLLTFTLFALFAAVFTVSTCLS